VSAFFDVARTRPGRWRALDDGGAIGRAPTMRAALTIIAATRDESVPIASAVPSGSVVPRPSNARATTPVTTKSNAETAIAI
jgi:hypothetical protein